MFLSPGSPVSIVEVIVETGPDLAETGHGRENCLQDTPQQDSRAVSFRDRRRRTPTPGKNFDSIVFNFSVNYDDVLLNDEDFQKFSVNGLQYLIIDIGSLRPFIGEYEYLRLRRSISNVFYME